MSEKLCRKCLTVKPFSDFGKDLRKKHGLRYTCRNCRNKLRRFNRLKNPAKFLEYENRPESKTRLRNSMLKRVYNLTLEQYEKLALAQKNKCKICGNPESHKTKKNLAVDHCHKTGKIRGLLCGNCNSAIGLLKNDIKLLKKIINYLKENEK